VKRAKFDIDGGVAPVFAKGETIVVPVGPIDLTPPKDPKITSLFITGVEDDLPEYAIKEFFAPYGQIRSVVCVHKARSAFVDFSTREGAEKACGNGDVVIKSNPLRVQWSKPRALGSIAEEQARDIVQANRKREQNREKYTGNQDERRRTPATVSIGEAAARNVNLVPAPPGAEGAGDIEVKGVIIRSSRHHLYITNCCSSQLRVGGGVYRIFHATIMGGVTFRKLEFPCDFR
jgi:RNA recognition motif. (a.k.a. RRM, RBD, or RNP domain)